MSTIDTIKNHLRAMPLPLRIGAGGFVALLLILLLTARGTSPRPTPPPPAAPASAASAKGHWYECPATPTHPAGIPAYGHWYECQNIPAIPPATPAPATTTAPPSAVLGPVMLPAQPAPANLARGTSMRTLAAAPQPVDYTGHPPTDWVSVATVNEPTPTASWSTSPGKTLQSVDPTSGYVRDTWTFWVQIEHAGPHTLVLRLSNGPAKPATVTIDGSASPAITTTYECGAWGGCGPAATAMATVGFAAGWHQVTVEITEHATDGATTAELYMRSPTEDLPTAIVPFAVAPTTQAKEIAR